jgi:2-polyprenyl-3-methyl-5-hydroxy-6-metoxy-1,4-benzoquinol methylase
MLTTTKALGRRVVHQATVSYGHARGRDYVEDFIRVYPHGFQYYPLGLRKRWSEGARRNFTNHRKLYEFCRQLVPGRVVYDIGCGAGYGFEVLARSGPRELVGCDLSRHAVQYARRHYSALASITQQNAIELSYRGAVADVTICSEVIEHLKDYQREQDLLTELNRITRPGGVIILATPNVEVSPGHGLSFTELSSLLTTNYPQHVLFENRVYLDSSSRRAYEARLEVGAVGLLSIADVVVSDTPQTVAASGELCDVIPKREGVVAPPRLYLGQYALDTQLLHNTHAFVAVCVKPFSAFAVKTNMDPRVSASS